MTAHTPPPTDNDSDVLYERLATVFEKHVEAMIEKAVAPLEKRIKWLEKATNHVWKCR
jgi:exonuclease VII small subunit